MLLKAADADAEAKVAERARTWAEQAKAQREGVEEAARRERVSGGHYAEERVPHRSGGVLHLLDHPSALVTLVRRLGQRPVVESASSGLARAGGPLSDMQPGPRES